jgi:uncharacterized membrane protein
MIRRRRNVPWIQRQSRLIIGAIAVVGFILTAYLTITSLTGNGTVAGCSADAASSGCGGVLSSSYAFPLDPVGKTGPPLSLFGSLGYLGMILFAFTPLFINPDKDKKLRQKLESWTWWFLLAGSFAMATFSGYLMYVLAFELKTPCPYCIGSAIFSLSLLIISIIGREWDEISTILLTGLAIVLLTLVGSVGIYSPINQANAETQVQIGQNGREIISQPIGEPKPPKGWEVSSVSKPPEIALAEHLTKQNVIMFGAYWCPHCYEQKQLFGKEAVDKIKYTECAPDGINPQTEACTNAGIRAFPAWVIDGKVYEGVQTLDLLADLTKYTGDRNFRYTLR